MGLRPELKSDENKVVPHLVIEISRCEYNIFFDFASLFRSMTPGGSCVPGGVSSGVAQAADGAVFDIVER